MANLNIKLVKSLNGRLEKQVATANSLGLRKIGDVTVQPASCCQSTPLLKLSSASTVTLWPLPLSVKLIGNSTPVIRRMVLSVPSLRVRVIFSGAAGCSPLAFSEQVLHRMSKSTFSRAEAVK